MLLEVSPAKEIKRDPTSGLELLTYSLRDFTPLLFDVTIVSGTALAGPLMHQPLDEVR